jgi:hypothetical protein
MNGGIFLIQTDHSLVEMKEQPYDTEDVLQQLLAEYPNLLAGDQMDEAAPRRWLLVSREVGVPDQEDGGDRWSLDHLFLDQDAIPTLIEVKRSSDTRIRREVVGQMLDYAANAVVSWPVETLRARFEEGCRSRGADPDEGIETLVGPQRGVENFWQRVKTNLQAGRIRMVFVADVIPPELRRVVEFLNGQMDPAEVLAVEIRQYKGQSGGQELKTLVPRVIGQTAEAAGKKPGRTPKKRKWDEASFFDTLREKRGEAEVAAARAILDWAKRSVSRVWWGEGEANGSFYPMLDLNGEEYRTFGVYAYGWMQVPFQAMQSRKPFGSVERREELLNRLNSVTGEALPADAINRYPSIPLGALTNEAALTEFLKVWDWYIEQVKAARP